MIKTDVIHREHQWRHLWAIIIYALPLFLALLLYGYSVTLPFFLDDGPHFQILAQTDGLKHWGDFPPFPFYRPFTFTFWKLFDGHYEPSLLHLINVLCFGMAGVVLGQVVRRIAPHGKMQAALIAGGYFILFPFSYQAVAMVAALFHLTLTLGMLLCLWAALRWLDGRGGWPMLVLCWVAAFCGVFSHENGVLLAPLLIGLLLLLYRPQKRLLWVILPVLTIVAVYLVLWLSFSPRDDTGLTRDFAGRCDCRAIAANPAAVDSGLWRVLVSAGDLPGGTAALGRVCTGAAPAGIAGFGRGWHFLGNHAECAIF